MRPFVCPDWRLITIIRVAGMPNQAIIYLAALRYSVASTYRRLADLRETQFLPLARIFATVGAPAGRKSNWPIWSIFYPLFAKALPGRVTEHC